MSPKLTQQSLNGIEFVCTPKLQEEHRALFFSSLWCGGVISNCESFSGDSRVPAWLPESEIWLSLMSQEQSVSAVSRFLNPAHSSPLVLFFFSSVSWSVAFCSVFSLRGGDQQHEEWAGEVWHPDARLQQDWRDPGQWALCGRSCMWEGLRCRGGGVR